ncbi:sugar ABC transporter permease [Clostridium sp.]|uniref:carbohydrate ABC transporter permease n=1 Tax=Clostridium sp. TaxID=1506 RepID=UPI0026108D58|nr:sugar ABC transporter permease [Clostridium sp.]
MRKKEENVWGYIFMTPVILGLSLFAIWPIFQSFFLSLHEWVGFGEKTFIGLQNFKEIVNNKEIYDAIFNTVRITICALPVSIIISLVISSILNSPTLKGKTIFRIIFYLPIITMPAAISIVFKYIFNYNYGIINQIIKSFGKEPIEWLGNPKYSWIVIVFIVIWAAIGSQIIILLAALQNIDYSMYEAAEIDGAGIITKFFKITVPSISPTIFFLSVTGFISMFQLFDLIFIMIGKNAGLESTRTIVFQFFETAFVQTNRGMGAAIAVVIFFIIMLVTLVQKRFEKKYVHY